MTKPDNRLRLSYYAGLFLRGLIIFYRYTLAYVLGGRCRFEPSCSAYALQALAWHGPIKGSRLAFKRLCRCHPLGGSGFDPVPGKGAG